MHLASFSYKYRMKLRNLCNWLQWIIYERYDKIWQLLLSKGIATWFSNIRSNIPGIMKIQNLFIVPYLIFSPGFWQFDLSNFLIQRTNIYFVIYMKIAFVAISENRKYQFPNMLLAKIVNEKFHLMDKWCNMMGNFFPNLYIEFMENCHNLNETIWWNFSFGKYKTAFVKQYKLNTYRFPVKMHSGNFNK